MNEHTQDSQVKDYYQQLTLSPQRAEAIAEAGDLVLAARRWKRTAIAATIGLAAMTLLAVGLFLRGIPGNDNLVDAGGANDQRPVASEDESGSTTDNGASESVDPRPGRFRLVAFRSHGDQCPHCRATGEVYRELAQSLGDAPVELEVFDLSQPASRDVVTDRIEELRLDALIEGRQETAFLALTGPDGTAVQEFKPSQGAESIADQIRQRTQP